MVANKPENKNRVIKIDEVIKSNWKNLDKQQKHNLKTHLQYINYICNNSKGCK